MDKLCFIIDSFRFGGAQKVTSDIASALANDNYEVEVFIYRNKIELSLDAKVKVHYIDIVGLSRRGIFGFLDAACLSVFGKIYQYYMSSFYSFFLKRKVNFSKYQHVFFCSDSGFFPFHKIKSMTSTYVLHSKKSTQYSLYKINFINKILFQKVKNVLSGNNLITVSAGIKNDVVDIFNIPSERITTIYNFIDSETIRKRAQEHCHVVNDSPYICHVGRHSQEKRIDVLIDAFELIACDKTDLLLIGDGPLNARLKEQANKSFKRDKIKFVGFISNPYPLIQGAKALVLSSEREGLPTVLIEALSLNTLVVSTNCPTGPNEILIDELSDFLCKVNDPEELAIKIDHAIESNSIANYSKFVTNFQQGKVINAYKNYLNSFEDIC